MFKITSIEIEQCQLGFLYDSMEQSGIVKILETVLDDMKKVFGTEPLADIVLETKKQIMVGCIETAPVIRAKAEAAGVNIGKIRNKREVYMMQQTTEADGTESLYILGSDKRGTIYGLFHLSELCGVSPFISWSDVMPAHREEVVIADEEMHASAEPSVKYRGFFINDEWPAFGNWAMKNFGGFNAKMYATVFELLLRLKGNYLWPAMWSAIFPNDGPGLENAELADELGVVMGMSHHEPCLRQGEEYKYLRGKDSIYGDAWNFRTNREGITRFWRDGLKRSGRFENVITVGMRGEADSTILPKDSTLADNIALLKDVLRVQADLIRENVNADLDQVPRMLALYKEVEPFYYGDETTEGLMEDPVLDGITLMLCDDNHGNLRTVPTEKMRKHRGGFGMYYHLDYHGCPISYEWVNSTALNKIWDQMSNAYEFGIRELWIVNVGDIFTNELPLAYFLDLAYDFDKWGRSFRDSEREYTEKFVRQLYGGRVDTRTEEITQLLLRRYTKWANMRRPEAMNDEVFAAFAYKEREMLQEKLELDLSVASKIMESLPQELKFPFYEFVLYPLKANSNLKLMWLDTTYNHALASMGAAMANTVADRVKERLAYDRELTKELHSIHDGRWYGMGLSEHVGFHRWCEEEERFPVTCYIEPANKPRIIAVVPETGQHTEGGFWSGIELTVPEHERYYGREGYIDLYAASDMDAGFKVTDIDPMLEVLPEAGVVPASGVIRLKVRLAKDAAQEVENETDEMTAFEKCARKLAHFRIKSEYMDTSVRVPIAYQPQDCIAIEAIDYDRQAGNEGRFEEIFWFGKTMGGMKCSPVTSDFSKTEDGPYLEYDLFEETEGDYTVRVYIAPGNPPFRDRSFMYSVQANEDERVNVQTIPADFAVTDHNAPWEQGVLDQIRINDCNVHLRAGWNTIRLYAGSPGVTFEKLAIFPLGQEPQPSYLGPADTKRITRK